MNNILDKSKVICFFISVFAFLLSNNLYSSDEEILFDDSYIKNVLFTKANHNNYLSKYQIDKGYELYDGIIFSKFENEPIAEILKELKYKYTYLGYGLYGWNIDFFTFVFKMDDSYAIFVEGLLLSHPRFDTNYDIAFEQLIKKKHYFINIYKVRVADYIISISNLEVKNLINIPQKSSDSLLKIQALRYEEIIKLEYPLINNRVNSLIDSLCSLKHPDYDDIAESNEALKFLYYHGDIDTLPKAYSISQIDKAEEMPDERLWLLSKKKRELLSFDEFSFSDDSTYCVGDIIRRVESKYKLVAYQFLNNQSGRVEFEIFLKKDELHIILIRGYLNNNDHLPLNDEEAFASLMNKSKFNLSIYQQDITLIDSELLDFLIKKKLTKEFPYWEN